MPESSYSLSKLVGERMAEQYARWDAKRLQRSSALRFLQCAGAAGLRQHFDTYNEDPFSRRFNLWTYIDARDAAQAVRLSLESKLTGAHVFGIANSNSLMRMDNDKLLDTVFPGTKRKRPLKPNESLISIEKAQTDAGLQAGSLTGRGEGSSTVNFNSVTPAKAGAQLIKFRVLLLAGSRPLPG